MEPRFVRILAQIESIRDALDQVEYDVVAMVREAGASWDRIGEDLGVSRQAARSRFSKVKRRRDP